MARSGARIFWASQASPPRVRLVEMAPVGVLLALCLALTAAAGPAMEYMQDTAEALHRPYPYIEKVLSP
jgi:multicomponent K+:H+ antiporter subunit D